MKLRIQRIIACTVFVALLVGAILKCADVLEYKEARTKYTPFYNSSTNFDVIFLGTSHMWNHVLPMEMWKDYGISSYNWGYSNCTPAENYYLIQDIVKYTSPKVVVLDVYGLTEYERYGNGKYRTDRIEQQHVQFDSLPIWSANKIKASKDVFDDYENNEDFIWNFIMYHNRWAELGENDFDYEITTEKGACFLTGLGTGSYTPISKDKKTEIDSACYPYFLNIIEFCQLQGIQVLCTYLPYSAGESQQKVANTIGDIVEKYPNCKYVNLLTTDIVDYNTDFFPDDRHLNYSGANKVTTWLGQYLKEHYSLDDYSSNESWENDYQLYLCYKEKTLKEQTDIASYLVQLKDDDFSCEAEIYDPRLMDSERLMLLFKNAEVEPTLTNSNTDKCIKLLIKNKSTGEIIEEAEFTSDSSKKLDIFKITKIVK